MNDVIVTGVVVSKWQYSGDTFMRLVSRRRRKDPPNPDGKDFDAFTLRFNYFLRRAEDQQLPTKGDVIRVTGFLQQRDDRQSLASLLRHRVEDTDPQVLQELHERLDGHPRRVHVRRDVTEVVVLAWERLRPRGEQDDEAEAEPEKKQEKAVAE